MLFKTCPDCHRLQTYTDYDAWLVAKQRNQLCRKCGRKDRHKLFVESGILPSEDRGSREWFIILNARGYEFEPKPFSMLGYFADGYDVTKHIWMEYDTAYHSKTYQRKKDLIRQSKIIKYFESIGNPLKEFTRVYDYQKGSLGIEVIYREGKYLLPQK